MENDPSNFNEFTVNAYTEEFGEMKLICDTNNSILYLHHPERNLQYDHIFRILSEQEIPVELRHTGKLLGGFIWREVLGHEEFENIANCMANSCNFQVIYNPEPTDIDRIEYNSYAIDKMKRELDEMDSDDWF